MDLAFDDSGGPGPAVVGLPMFGTGRATTAAALGPALHGSAVRQIYLDPPGHGDSPAAEPADSETALASVTAWLEDHLDEPARVAGFSFGGYLAAALARRRPDLVAGLLLVCPGVYAQRSRRTLPDADPGPAPEGWLDHAPADLREHLDVALGHRSADVVAVVTQALRAGGPGDEEYQDAVYEGPGLTLTDEDDDVVFPGPVTVVTGRQDRLVGYADQFRAMRNYPNGTFVTVDGAGHYLPFEQPALLRAHVEQWLHRTGGD